MIRQGGREGDDPSDLLLTPSRGGVECLAVDVDHHRSGREVGQVLRDLALARARRRRCKRDQGLAAFVEVIALGSGEQSEREGRRRGLRGGGGFGGNEPRSLDELQ
jgi:hypothetical protein